MGQFDLIIEKVKDVDLFFDFGPGVPGSEAWELKKIWKDCEIIGVEACKERYERIKKDFPGWIYHAAIDEHTGKSKGYVGGKYGMFNFGLELPR